MLHKKIDENNQVNLWSNVLKVICKLVNKYILKAEIIFEYHFLEACQSSSFYSSQTVLDGCGTDWFWVFVAGLGWLWLVLGCCGWLWVVLAGFGWLWTL